MPGIGSIDWQAMLLPDTPIIEIVIRGSLMYLALFCLLRFVQKRQSSSLSTSDVLVIVLLADAAQNAMADDYQSIPDGVLLVAVIVMWSVGLNWLGYHSRRFAAVLHPPPLELVRDGRPIVEHLRRAADHARGADERAAPAGRARPRGRRGGAARIRRSRSRTTRCSPDGGAGPTRRAGTAAA